MPDAPSDFPGQAPDAVTRVRLLVMLRQDLALASSKALDRGMAPEVLSAELDGRIARLRALLTGLEARRFQN